MKYFKDAAEAVFAFASDGSQDDFIPAGLVEITEADADTLRFAPVVVIPTSVTRRQFKRALLDDGLLDVVDATVSASLDRALHIDWAEAQTFERSNAFVTGMGAALGKTDSDIDAIFIKAATYL